MNLYIDIGNTNIKLSFDNEIFYFNSRREYTPDEMYSVFPDKLKNVDIIEIYASSVVPRHIKLMDGIFEKNYGVKIQWLGTKLKSGIMIETENPKEVGSDLVALSAYAASRYDESIIVNMGTATTITHVKNKAIKGVVISAGLESQYKSLIKSADQLSEINFKFINKSLGKNTMDAISIGVVNGHIEMMKGLVNNINSSCNVIISGGNASFVKNNVDFQYVSEATIEGLKIIGELNDK